MGVRNRTIAFGTVLIIAFLGTTIAGQSPSVTNADVIKMIDAGLGEPLIVQTVKNAPSTAFDITPDSLIALKAAGVPDAVIAEMLSRRATAASVAPSPAGVTVPDGTEIKLRLLTPASSGTSRVEDQLRFEVLDDERLVAS